MELHTGEIPIEISVDDIRLYEYLWEIIRPWNWGSLISVTLQKYLQGEFAPVIIRHFNNIYQLRNKGDKCNRIL